MNPIKYTIDESPRIFGPEFFRDVHSLINTDLRRDILAKEELINGHSENVSINLGHPTHLPVFGALLDEPVDFIAALYHAPDQAFTESHPLLVGAKTIPEEV